MKEHYKGLGHIAIYTADMEQSIAFYENIGGSVFKRDGVQTPDGEKKLAHLKQLDLLAGRAGEEPVLQAAEGVRQDLLFRCGEADDAGRLEVSRGLVEIVNVNGEVRNAALAGRHERACGRLDQLEQEAAEFNECQLLQAFRRLYAALPC